MARGKQQQEKKDGQHRKETKEERRARLQAEKEARDVSPVMGADGRALHGSACHRKDSAVVLGLSFSLNACFSLFTLFVIGMSKDSSLCGTRHSSISCRLWNVCAFSAGKGTKDSKARHSSGRR